MKDLQNAEAIVEETRNLLTPKRIVIAAAVSAVVIGVVIVAKKIKARQETEETEPVEAIVTHHKTEKKPAEKK